VPLEGSEHARKPRNVVTAAGVAGVARGERGERGPGYQERLTDSREAIYLERVELATLTPPQFERRLQCSNWYKNHQTMPKATPWS